MMIRLAVSLAAALVLSLLALGTVWLRQAYSALSEKHALAEAALRRRDRLSAMGELASTVAHEVRNPLNAHRDERAAPAPRVPGRRCPAARPRTAPSSSSCSGVVEGETRRINDVVQQFLEYARPPRLAPREVDLGGRSARRGRGRPARWPRRAACRWPSRRRRAGRPSSTPAQLRQAVDNLVRNAIEATPPAGGSVTVSVRTGGKGHTIEVRDTGGGIAPDDLPKIFDLYFTTKPDGHRRGPRGHAADRQRARRDDRGGLGAGRGARG